MAYQIAYLRKRACDSLVQTQQGLFDTVGTTLYNSGHWGNKTHKARLKILLWPAPNYGPRIPGSFLNQMSREIRKKKYFIKNR